MTIFGITMLMFGIFMAQSMISKAGEIKAEIDVNTENEIARFLNTGSRVTIPNNKVEATPGETKVFGLGIKNTYSDTRDFYVVVKSNSKNPTDIKTLPASGTTREIKANEQTAIAIAAKIPNDAPAKVYIVDVTVCEEFVSQSDPPDEACDAQGKTGNVYGKPQKIYITVK